MKDQRPSRRHKSAPEKQSYSGPGGNASRKPNKIKVATEFQSQADPLTIAFFLSDLNRRWHRLSPLQRVGYIIFLSTLTAVSVNILFGLFSNLYSAEDSHTPGTCPIDVEPTILPPAPIMHRPEPIHASILPVSASVTTLALTEVTEALQHNAVSIAAASEPISTPAMRRYPCPELPSFFKPNKVIQDETIRLQKPGCSKSDDLLVEEKQRRNMAISVEHATIQHAGKLQGEILTNYKHLPPIDLYLFQQAVKARIQLEIATQLNIARCAGTQTSALAKILKHYFSNGPLDSFPIIFMVSAKGSCGLAKETRVNARDIIVEDHRFMVLVDSGKISLSDLNTMISADIPKKTLTLASLIPYTPEVCDPWQGSSDTYQLADIPERYPDGTYPLWHPKAWNSTVVDALFYLPTDSKTRALVAQLTDESSVISEFIRDSIASTITQIVATAPPDAIKALQSVAAPALLSPTVPSTEPPTEPSTSTPTPRQYHCPPTTLFITNKPTKDGYIGLQKKGCADLSSTVSAIYKQQRANIAIAEEKLINKAGVLLGAMLNKVTHASTSAADKLLLQYFLEASIQHEISTVWTKAARCGAIAYDTLWQIVRDYYQRGAESECPIIFRVTTGASNVCGLKPEELRSFEHMIIQDHTFLVLVDNQAIKPLEQSEIASRGIKEGLATLTWLHQFPNAEICDPWQGAAPTYRLQDVPPSHPDGTLSLWHVASWENEPKATAMFYLSDSPKTIAYIRQLTDESSQLYQDIRQGVSAIVDTMRATPTATNTAVAGASDPQRPASSVRP